MSGETRGRYFEDFEVGQVIETMGRTVTEADLVNFIGVSGMFEELFINREFAENESIYKRRLVPGALTYAIQEGLSVQLGLIHRTGLAFLGLELRIPAPTLVGDTIHVEIETIDKRETRQRDRGIVTYRHTVKNQRGETVMVADIKRMIQRRPD
jgi:acyl dehydratase